MTEAMAEKRPLIPGIPIVLSKRKMGTLNTLSTSRKFHDIKKNCVSSFIQEYCTKIDIFYKCIY